MAGAVLYGSSLLPNRGLAALGFNRGGRVPRHRIDPHRTVLRHHAEPQGPFGFSTVAHASRVVVVESPSKATAIQKYLGDDYKVLASYGHICDLPAKNGSVLPDKDFEMVWELSPKNRQHVGAIEAALETARELILATDPDREGEAISWHVQQALAEATAARGVEVRRVTFNEVTKKAVLEAMDHPREVSLELVNAYLARRALDYLVGFTLSPLLWRKLPGSKSAGRVQSVALRLVCAREAEVEAFQSQEYWTVEADLVGPDGATFTAQLTEVDGEKLGKFGLATEAAAAAAAARVATATLDVSDVTRREVSRSPPPPFITSTLQQDASAKMGFGASKTMMLAQRLYEGGPDGAGGLITYMRTDGVNLAPDAVAEIRSLVAREVGLGGTALLPDEPPRYKSRSKNAQEAHEAIRPTDPSRLPADLPGDMELAQRRLYALIWRRAVGSQLAPARFERTRVEVSSDDGALVLKANGSEPVFDGFLAVAKWEPAQVAAPPATEESEAEDEAGGRDMDGDSAAESKGAEPGGGKSGKATGGSQPLPAGLAKGVRVSPDGGAGATPSQHFTQPPPRFTEGTLVKALEEKSIGRPSTYAPTVRVLQDRQYIRKEGGKLIPESRGRVLTAFLVSFFDRYVDYSFTADLEDKLDEVSGGRLDWQQVLRDFWSQFDADVGEVRDVRISQVIDALDELLGPHFFPPPAPPSSGGESEGGGDDAAAVPAPVHDPRQCPKCAAGGGAAGRLGLKLSKNGGFIGCSNYPECSLTLPMDAFVSGNYGEQADDIGPRVLGEDPATGLEVKLMIGPYGPYVMLGEDGDLGKGKKAKKASLGKGKPMADVTIEAALKLLELPKDIGVDPESGLAVRVCWGPYGPYVRMGAVSASLPKEFRDAPVEVPLERALELIAAKRDKMQKQLASGKGGRGGGAGGAGGRGRRGVKAPPGPKAAKSAYALWAMDNRERISEEIGTRALPEVSKEQGARWKAISEEERARYQAMAAEDKERHRKELAFHRSLVGGDGGEKAKAKGGPKRARSAYILFTSAHRAVVAAENPDASFAEITKILARRWADVQAVVGGRAEYEAQATADKERYAAELAAWEAEHPDPEGSESEEQAAASGSGSEGEAGRPAGGARKAGRRSVGGATIGGVKVKKPLSPYMMFCREARAVVQAENPEARFGDIGKMLGGRWGAMGPEERAPYAAMAEEDKARYAAQMAEAEAEAADSEAATAA